MAWADPPSFFQLQNRRLLSADTGMKGRSELVLVDFRCVEGLSTNFEISARFASQDPKIELKQMIGRPVTISVQLNNALASSDRRFFHGYVTQFSHVGTDGGLAIYTATIQPWLWMLSRRQDIRIFQEMSAEQIIAEVFREYEGLASYEFRLSKATPNRSYCTQYRETDLDFVLRLLQEEGLFFYFEHAKDGHKLVIVDDSTRAKPIDGPSAQMPYSQDETMDDIDVITSLQSSRQLASSSSALKSRDYKVPGARRSALSTAKIKQGDVPVYQIYDYLGEHAYPDSERGQQLARFRTEALAAGSKVFSGTSTSRRLAPMRYVQIEKHYDHKDAQPEDRQFMLITVTHSGRNNYQAGAGEGATYDCTFTCIRKKIPYRQALTIERPTIPGPQTATVVGPEGEEIYTDEMGRVKLQFHWDRLGKRDQASSCWVRQSQSWAGRGYGMIHVPRIGDEVVVSFLDGSPDRPIITSRVVNGVNRTQWNMPSQRALSGFVSKEVGGQQNNVWLKDDTKGQVQTQIRSDHLESGLHLGYLTRVSEPAGRGDKRGEGAELRTDGHASVRGARGLLLTSYSRPAANGDAFSVDEINGQLADAQSTAENLAKRAQSAGAQDGEQVGIAAALKGQAAAIKGGGALKALTRPHTVVASPAGIVASAQEQIHLSSGTTAAVTSGEHISMTAGGGFFASVRQALRLFVYQAGMRLVAAGGDIDLKALKDSINVLAKMNVTVTANKIRISAQEEVEISGGGSYTRWNGGQIKSGSSGAFEVHAANHALVGPDNIGKPASVASSPAKDELHFALRALPGGAHYFAEEPYELFKGGAKIGEGVTDEFGRVVIKDHEAGTPAYQIKLSNGAKYDLHVKDALHDNPDHADQRTNRGERLS